MYAVIQTGGKQYKVSEGDVIFVEKLGVEEGSTYTFDQVLAVSGADGFKVGAPTVAGATVTANVVKNGKGKKIQAQEERKEAHRSPPALHQAPDPCDQRLSGAHHDPCGVREGYDRL